MRRPTSVRKQAASADKPTRIQTAKRSVMRQAALTWIRLSTFSCTTWGGSFFGPITLTSSCMKSLCAITTWKRLPQFLTHVSRTCKNNTNHNYMYQQNQWSHEIHIQYQQNHWFHKENKSIKLKHKLSSLKVTDSHRQCVHYNCVVFANIGYKLFLYCFLCIFRTETWFDMQYSESLLALQLQSQ